MPQFFWIGGTLKMKRTKFPTMPKLTIELMTIAQFGIKVERSSNHNWILANKLLVTSLLLKLVSWSTYLIKCLAFHNMSPTLSWDIASWFNRLQYVIVHHLTMELTLQGLSSFLPPWRFLQTPFTRVLSLRFTLQQCLL